MSDRLRFGWFIPTSGDTTRLGAAPLEIPPSAEHFLAVARAAEAAGFEYVLVPVQTACWEAYITCAFVIAQTTRLSALLAARGGFVAPTVMAKMIATFDQLSGGRVRVNLIAGGGVEEMAADGLFADHDDRYAMIDEAVEIMKRVWTERRPVDFAGRHYRVAGARCVPRPFQSPHPPFYLGGSSEAALALSVRHADVHLFWGDTPAAIAEQVGALATRSAAAGRAAPPTAGMRLHVIVRDTEAEAWDAAWALIEGGSDARRRYVAGMWEQSEAHRHQQRLAAASAAHGYRLGGHPHLWSGIATLRPGAGAAVVGDPEQVAATLEEFVAAGCREFCLSGYRHDEEARRFGELVLPRFAGRLAPPWHEAAATGSE
ncbi:MAG: LLM class flavin-dependent oxidoreductase [Acidimicrobiales bacterium]